MSVDSTTTTHSTGTSNSPATSNSSVGRRHPSNPPSLNETANDAIECFQHYAKERPDVVAMCCLGVGFVLGWKLKPW